MVKSMTEHDEINTVTLESLGALRRRIDQGRELLMAGGLAPDRYERAIERLSGLMRVYSNHLTRYRESIPYAQRERLIVDWYDRLYVGWERGESDAVIERFTQILSEYEVLCDSLLGLTVVSQRMTTYMRGIHERNTNHLILN